MSAEHPTPWHIEGQTIRDANGYVVVSAINPCNMSTRRLIVEAVNERDTLKQRLKDTMEIADAFHNELQHVLDCLCYAGQTKSSLAGAAMEKAQTESLKATGSRTGEYVPRVGEVENRLKPHATPCGVTPDAPGTFASPDAMASGVNRGGDPTRRSATYRETPRKRCGESREGCGLANGHGNPLPAGAGSRRPSSPDTSLKGHRAAAFSPLHIQEDA